MSLHSVLRPTVFSLEPATMTRAMLAFGGRKAVSANDKDLQAATIVRTAAKRV